MNSQLIPTVSGCLDGQTQALLEYGQMSAEATEKCGCLLAAPQKNRRVQSAEATEKCGCLLLCLSEYAQSLEE